MKKYLFFVVFTLLLSLAFVAGRATYAQAASFDCIAGNCIALYYWDGASYGGSVKAVVSDPGLHDTNSYW